MTTITIWLLIAISYGYNNKGTVTVVDRFATQQDCYNVSASLEHSTADAKFICQEAKVLKP